MGLKIDRTFIGLASLGISGALLYFNWKNSNSQDIFKLSGGGSPSSGSAPIPLRLIFK